MFSSLARRSKKVWELWELWEQNPQTVAPQWFELFPQNRKCGNVWERIAKKGGKSVSFEYERQAKAGEPMPDGLTIAEQMYYQSLALLSARYRYGGISAEDSVKEKRLLEREYLNMKGKERYISASVMLWMDVESAATAFAKEQTMENAYKMYEAIYGCVLKKREAISEQ